MHEKKIGIILVNYNGLDDTLECINSIKKNNYNNFTIIVVDNNSTIGNIELALQHISQVELIKNEVNCGFAIANNVGIQRALKIGVDYIILLNNDTIVKQDFCELMVTIARNNNAKVLTCKISYFAKPDSIWYSGGEFDFKKGYGIHYTDNHLADEVNEVSFISGCCLMAIKEVFEEYLLPEDYFMYFEDVDFSILLKEKGYQLYYTPMVEISHKVSASVGVESPFFIYYWNRNRIVLFEKYKSRLGLNYYLYIAKFMASRGIKTIIYIFNGQFKELVAMLRGLFSVYKYKKEKNDHES
jgi:GT2 family glycosyltransferase